MIEYTYTIGEVPFEEWAQAHQDCEMLHMKGLIVNNIEGEVVGPYGLIIMKMPSLIFVDVEYLGIIIDYNWYEDDMEYDLSEENDIDYYTVDKTFKICIINQEPEYEEFNHDLGLLGRMVENKDYDTTFKIIKESNPTDNTNKEYIVTSDGKTLIWMRTTKKKILSGFADGSTQEYVYPYRKCEIPIGIERIGYYALSHDWWNDPIEITFPDSIKELDEGAFAYTNIETLSIPESIVKIGCNAFYFCRITSLHLPKSLKVIPKGCFFKCCLKNLEIPGTIEEIQDYAFSLYNRQTVYIPEGVRKIGAYSFSNVRKIEIPPTLQYLDPNFGNTDDPKGWYDPVVHVSPDNPWFYDIDGILYRKGEKEQFLEGVIKKPISHRLIKIPDANAKVYTAGEIYADYPSNNIKPINSKKTRFWVYMPDSGHNIIDLCKHHYLDAKNVYGIEYILDGPILVEDEDHNHHLYSNDLSQVLISDEDAEYKIYTFDNKGRVYISQDEPFEKGKSFPFASTPAKFWCIYYDETPVLTRKYEGLGVFSKDGIATAKLNKKWGMINLQEEVVIPFEYSELGSFDEYGMAMAKKGQKRGYINRKNEVVIPFKYDMFYHSFDENGVAIAMTGRGYESLSYFIDRKNNVLGSQIKDAYFDGIWSQKFHIFEKDGLYGYCRQFGEEFSGCIYKEIEMVKPDHIRVSLDGIHFEDIPYDADTKI